MRRKTMGRAWALAALAAVAAWAPGGAFAQSGDYAPPSGGNFAFFGNANLPVPLWSTQPAFGGLFFNAGFAFYHQTNPLVSQPVGYSGFIVSDPLVSDPSGTATIGLGVPSGTFLGNRSVVLDVNQVTGPATYQPGFVIDGGWRFGDGSALTVSWLFLTDARYNAAASLLHDPLQRLGGNLENSFITAFVFNFPNEYAGPFNKVTQPNPLSPPNPPFVPAGGAVYGIWNGASVMTEAFVQRSQQLEATYRVPIYETECYRLSGLVGPRFFWIYENFRWTTQDFDFLGNQSPIWMAIYNNIVSNRMYGAHVGLQQEYYVGHGWAFMLTGQVAGFADVVKEEAKYGLGPRGTDGPGIKRAIRTYTFVPEVQGTCSVMWYPWEGVQMSVGYDVFAFFNTVSSPRPIDFNFGAVDPNYERTFRWFNGLQASVAISF
jgi:hypothetical protein